MRGPYQRLSPEEIAMLAVTLENLHGRPQEEIDADAEQVSITAQLMRERTAQTELVVEARERLEKAYTIQEEPDVEEESVEIAFSGEAEVMVPRVERSEVDVSFADLSDDGRSIVGEIVDTLRAGLGGGRAIKVYLGFQRSTAGLSPAELSELRTSMRVRYLGGKRSPRSQQDSQHPIDTSRLPARRTRQTSEDDHDFPLVA